MFDLTQVESAGAGALKPGIAKVVLEKVEVSQDGKGLDLFFKGAEPSNPGSFKPRFWLNNVDPSDPKYDAVNAGNQVKQMKQILEAFLDNDAVAAVKGSSAAEFFASFAAAFANPAITAGVVAEIKSVYKWNSDTDAVIPKYGPFISTEFRPRGLKIGDKTDKRGAPYDRILPLAEYGISADAGAPTPAATDAPFAAETPVPQFGS